MQESLFGKDKIFFAMALSKLLNKPIHGYVRNDHSEGKINWKLEVVFCDVSPYQVLTIDGIKNRKEIELQNKGNMELTTNNHEHLLEFIGDSFIEDNLEEILNNYTAAIIDTYGELLGKTKKMSRSN